MLPLSSQSPHGDMLDGPGGPSMEAGKPRKYRGAAPTQQRAAAGGGFTGSPAAGAAYGASGGGAAGGAGSAAQNPQFTEALFGIHQLLLQHERELQAMQGRQDKWCQMQEQWHGKHDAALRLLSQRLEDRVVSDDDFGDFPVGHRVSAEPLLGKQSLEADGEEASRAGRQKGLELARPSQKSMVTVKEGLSLKDQSKDGTQPPPLEELYIKIPPLLSKCVYSPLFDFGISCVIALNTGVIAFETDWKARFNEALPEGFIYVPFVFVCIFSIEFSLRAFVDQQFLFKGPNKLWNLFDLTLLIMSLFELLGLENNGSALKALKIVRVFKVFRVFRFFADLRKMVVGIMATLASLMWAMVVLAMIMFVFALVLTEMVNDLFQAGSVDSDIHGEFRSLYNTFYSLFKAMSGGTDWGDLSDPLVEQNPIYFFIFALYMSLIVYCVLNVVTAVFVEKMCKDEDARKYSKRYSELSRFVDMADTDGDGQMDWAEFQMHTRKPQVVNWLRSLDLDLDSIGTRELFDALNSDGDKISKDEFISGILQLQGYARSFDLFQLRQEVSLVTDSLQDLANKMPQTHAPRERGKLGRAQQEAKVQAKIHSMSIPGKIPDLDNNVNFVEDGYSDESKACSPLEAKAMISSTMAGGAFGTKAMGAGWEAAQEQAQLQANNAQQNRPSARAASAGAVSGRQHFSGSQLGARAVPHAQQQKQQASFRPMTPPAVSQQLVHVPWRPMTPPAVPPPPDFGIDHEPPQQPATWGQALPRRLQQQEVERGHRADAQPTGFSRDRGNRKDRGKARSPAPDSASNASSRPVTPLALSRPGTAPLPPKECRF